MEDMPPKDSELKDDQEKLAEEDFENLDETEKIKYNLKNSSKVYYKITHSINDEVTE